MVPTTRTPLLKTVIEVLIWIEALAFVIAAVLHTGIRLPLVPDFFHDPRIVGATVVEGLCAAALAGAAIMGGASAPMAWAAAVSAQIFSIVADLFGMLVIALGFGPDSPFNFFFHRVGVVVLILVLAGLLTPSARHALSSRRDNEFA
jgi:hypothetical protein